MGGGELLELGEVELDEGDQYATPWLVCAHSTQGLDGIRATYHEELRARSRHPRAPRPVVLNTWEAVYFNQGEDVVLSLVEAAARVGIERVVLDDGWFGSRRDDNSGLGDWTVSAEVWPRGLTPLIDRVHSLGMQFGLWIEPEMVNLDSELARAHPDWLLSAPGHLPPAARSQHVLDVAHPRAFAHLLETIDDLLTQHPIDALKWDHNRDIVDAWHQTDRGPRPGVHTQTMAVYRLLDELRTRHPQVEIESCAGGGGRVDLEILERTDRIWASDSNDPLERQRIQRWTSLLLPPELVGAHVGPGTAHTTGRTTSIDFRAGTALFGNFGVEWDLTHASSDELADLADWIRVYKRFRSLIHTGRSVYADHSEDAAQVHGVVNATATEALFAYVQLSSSSSAPPPPCRLPGLLPHKIYRVELVSAGQAPLIMGRAGPPWFTAGGATVPGSFLGSAGLPLPSLAPLQLFVMHVKAVDDSA